MDRMTVKVRETIDYTFDIYADPDDEEEAQEKAMEELCQYGAPEDGSAIVIERYAQVLED